MKTNIFFQRIPDHEITFSPSSVFFLYAERKTITERKQRRIPPKKKINPGPGFDKDPMPIVMAFKVIKSPKQNHKKLVILSYRPICLPSQSYVTQRQGGLWMNLSFFKPL